MNAFYRNKIWKNRKTPIKMQTHTYIHDSFIHACIHTYYIHIHTHTHMHTYTRAYTHPHAHAHTHTHTCAYTYM